MVLREGIRPPKFADKFDTLDFESWPMPSISLYPVPEPIELNDLSIEIVGLDCKPLSLPWRDCGDIERVTLQAPLICQIFNWSEVLSWSGIRLVDFLSKVGLELADDQYLAFYSRDGSYFESLPFAMAKDPRVLLATGMNGQPLRPEFGGPLRLVVPFLQGYKSVKWLGGIKAFARDPQGIKRLLGQSKTGHLGLAWRVAYNIEQEAGAEKSPV
jgi:DMSO/TMAO reductase YedYZ molybdopterin-dependent catalytic subunit